MKEKGNKQTLIAETIGKDKSRVGSFPWMAKLNCKNTVELDLKAIELLEPQTIWIFTITGDNGKEFEENKKIAGRINIDFYFATPFHPWKRKANENTNGLICQCFPKGSSFENITNKDIQGVQHKLNN